MSRNNTPKEEPRDSPFPTPNSNRVTPVRPKRARNPIDDDDSEDLTVVRPAPNLGESILTSNVQRARQAYYQALLTQDARAGSTARSGSPDLRKRLRRDGGQYNGRRYAEGEDLNPCDGISEPRGGPPDGRRRPRRAGVPYDGGRHAEGGDFHPRDDIPEPRGGDPDERSRPRRAGVPYDGGRYAEDEDFDPHVEISGAREGPSLRYKDLDADQKRVVDLAIKGDRKNICVVGGAGTGKSVICEIIVDELKLIPKIVAVVTPSGTSALTVGAVTLHSFFGLGKEANKGIEEFTRTMNSAVKRRLRSTDCLIIDEISMVSHATFDRMERMARAARKNDLPFGGMQIIVSGDFCQLPPVKPYEHCLECGREREGFTTGKLVQGRVFPEVWRCTEHGDISSKDRMWAFKSPMWDSLNFEYIALNQAHRQQDPTFLQMLDKLRHGKSFNRDEVNLLRDHDCDVKNAVLLVATKAKAYNENRRKLDMLRGRRYQYWCRDDFLWQRDLHPELADVNESISGALTSHAYERKVELKVGQPVILLRNMDIQKGLVNGSQGVIDHFIPYDPANQPHDSAVDGGQRWQLRYERVRDFFEGGYGQRDGPNSMDIPVVKFHNVHELVPIYPDCSVVERGWKKPHSLLIRTQLPLLSGWALTIHKAQGMTLEKAIVQVDDFKWCGMAYVALSRVKTLGGLKIEGLRANNLNVTVDEEVKAFLETKFGDRFD